MNISILVKKLEEMGVPKRIYSINGHLAPDTYFLNQIYDRWECFYFDERGEQNDYRVFYSEHEACNYFLKVLKEEMRCY